MQRAIVYTGNFLFPDGNAAGKRVFGNVKAMIEAGYRVACVCFRKDRMDEGILVHEVEEVVVYTIPYAQGFKRMNNSLAKKLFMKALQDLQKNCDIQAVLMYGSLGTTQYNLAVIRMCRKRGIDVIYDMVDLFDDPLKNNFLRYVIKKWDLQILLKRVLPACDRWIAISSYLKERMPDPSRTIIVPPLSVTISKSPVMDSQQYTTFTYASLINEKNLPVSSWKDRVDAIIDVFYEVHTERGINQFVVNFVGFTAQDLLAQFQEDQREEYRKKLEILEKQLVFHGLLRNQDAQEVIRKSDFTILLRDIKTCTSAGFPTKVSESLSLGVPVIANATSDIAMYVQDMVNGCIVPAPHDIEGIADRIEELIALTREQKDAMRDHAAMQQPFYYGNYVEGFKAFLEG